VTRSSFSKFMFAQVQNCAISQRIRNWKDEDGTEARTISCGASAEGLAICTPPAIFFLFPFRQCRIQAHIVWLNFQAICIALREQ